MYDARETGLIKPPTFSTWSEDDQETVHTLPTKLAVCHICQGTGTHVNPSIDRHGLTAEDFREDPDFAESYFSGVYDQTCNGCGGRNVVPVLDIDACDPELLKAYEDYQTELAYSEAERAGELRAGC